MKRLFIILTFCSLLQAGPQDVIIKVKNLAHKVPDRAAFIVAITRVPKGEKQSLLDLTQQISPRLYATLQRAKTSLVFTDDELKKKLHELEQEQNLLSVLEAQNIDGALQAIKSGADVNTTTQSGHTALMLAVLKADQEAVRDLLKQNVRVDYKGKFVFDSDAEVEYMNALELAQRLNYQPIVEILNKALV